MTLEWIRRKHGKFDAALKMYLFTTGDITKIEEALTGEKEQSGQLKRSSSRSTVGNLKGS